MLSKGLSLWSRAGPCARGHAALSHQEPDLREASPLPSFLSHHPVCARHVHHWVHSHTWVHGHTVNTDSGLHTRWAPAPQHLKHTHPHVHTHVYTISIAHVPSLRAHTHTLVRTSRSYPPLPTHIIYAPICSHPSPISVHTLGADRPSHATNRFTPTFRYPPGHSSCPPPAPGPWSSSDTLLSCTRARSCTYEHLVHMPTHAHVCEHLFLAHLCTRVPTPASALFHSCVHTPIHTPALHTLVQRHQSYQRQHLMSAAVLGE